MVFVYARRQCSRAPCWPYLCSDLIFVLNFLRFIVFISYLSSYVLCNLCLFTDFSQVNIYEDFTLLTLGYIREPSQMLTKFIMMVEILHMWFQATIMVFSDCKSTLSNGFIKFNGRCFEYEWWRKLELE